MTFRYKRLRAKHWPALDDEIQAFLADTEVTEIEAVSMGLGDTGNPEARLFYRGEERDTS